MKTRDINNMTTEARYVDTVGVAGSIPVEPTKIEGDSEYFGSPSFHLGKSRSVLNSSNPSRKCEPGVNGRRGQTLEHVALQSVAARRGWTVHRAKKDLLRETAKILGAQFWAEQAEGDEEDDRLPVKDARRFYFQEIFGRFRRVPDGWVVVPSDRPDSSVVASVIAIEVEDTHRLSIEKLREYGYLWWGFDGTMELELYLVAVDRYGHTETWFDMTTVGYMTLGDGAEISTPLVMAPPQLGIAP